MRSNKVSLKHYRKSHIHDHYILELKFWVIHDKDRFPDGIKYSLICKDERNGKKVLFDNHVPKGHHYHLDEIEYNYEFTTEKKLLEDFQKHVLQHLGVKI